MRTGARKEPLATDPTAIDYILILEDWQERCLEFGGLPV